MKKRTTVHLNEWTQIVLEISIEDFDVLIENQHDIGANFMTVLAENVYHTDGAIQLIDKEIRLYTKRILFYF